MQYPKKILITVLAAALLIPNAAWAKPKVDVVIVAEKEITVAENGKQIVKRIPATESAPGEIVIYNIDYGNSGDEPANSVVIDDPIPEGTVYVLGSATQTGEVTFSIDGGKSYRMPSLLTYDITTTDGKKESRTASPDQYTHIRWQIPTIAPGQRSTVSFKVKFQ